MPNGTADTFVALACIRFLRGGLPAIISFERARPSRLTVGSGLGANVRVERPEVAPRQFDVIWDGQHLWLQDALRLGRTFVNGRTLNEWLPVVGQAVVCFAGVRLWMSARTSRPVLSVPDFEALDRAHLTEAHHSARLGETGRITLTPGLIGALNEQDAR